MQLTVEHVIESAASAAEHGADALADGLEALAVWMLTAKPVRW